MKLRNKKTGEIKDLEFNSLVSGNADCCVLTKGEPEIYTYTSLAELNEEWEDYEEPKRHWIIDTMNDRVEDFDVPMAFNESIGNYFETREEAEKAVEKLKAWKRLKDKGFRFNNFIRDAIYYEISDEEIEKDVVREDLDLLFGGEE